MRFLGKLLITTFSIVVTAAMLPGISVHDPLRALLLALVLAVLNVTVKPVLIIFTIPFTIFTLGLFLLVVNALIILLADWLMGSYFQVDGFWWALLFSIILAIINAILEMLLFTAKREEPH